MRSKGEQEMSNKGTIVEVKGGVVQDVRRDGQPTPHEIHDYDCGNDCTNCGAYISDDDAFIKLTPDIGPIPYHGQLRQEYFLCPRCANIQGIKERIITIHLKEWFIAELTKSGKRTAEIKEMLDDTVNCLKSAEAIKINYAGEAAQIRYLVESGVRPEYL
jgi:hypothetical protein